MYSIKFANKICKTNLICQSYNRQLITSCLGSATIHPCVLSNPRLWAASAAAAIVFTLFGAKGQSSRTGPTGKQVEHLKQILM